MSCVSRTFSIINCSLFSDLNDFQCNDDDIIEDDEHTIPVLSAATHVLYSRIQKSILVGDSKRAQTNDDHIDISPTRSSPTSTSSIDRYTTPCDDTQQMTIAHK